MLTKSMKQEQLEGRGKKMNCYRSIEVMDLH